jgi:ABC-type cobalamin/Fe3+-siderophores transport system ATPase subunit
MTFELTIKNYRCFSEANPASISFGDGFTAVIGSNNSGKSSLLRFFYEFRGLFMRLSDPAWFPISLGGTPSGFNLAPSVLDTEELFHNQNDRDITIEVVVAKIRLLIRVVRSSNTCRCELQINGQNIAGNSVKIQDGKLVVGGSVCADSKQYFDACNHLTNTLYIGPFRNAINVGSKNDYFDIQVGQAFIQQWREVKTGNSVKQNEAANRLTQDIKRIFQFSDFEINPSSDDQTLQLFIDGKSFKLPTVGAGLTQFIMVLANAAVKRPSLILIDEPELNLHPSLQIDFLTTLASYSRNGNIVFATHSIGLARASAKRIYSLRKIATGKSVMNPYEATPRLAELLGELSFSGYREIGFDKVLLVEGTTDLVTVQQFLRFFGKDHNVMLLPLGGGQLIRAEAESHLLELKRICPEIAALIDSEKQNEGAPLDLNRQGFLNACEKTGVSCHILKRRAIENYLSDRAIKTVKGEKYRALTDFEDLKNPSPSWSKSEDWLIAREMTKEELMTTDLGEFLEKL